jgi:hypothetical protein
MAQGVMMAWAKNDLATIDELVAVDLVGSAPNGRAVQVESISIHRVADRKGGGALGPERRWRPDQA